MVGRLEVSAVNKVSTVLNLFYKDESPVEAQDVLNALIDSYSNSNIKEKNALTGNTIAFIDERLKSVVKDLEGIESKIQKYKSQQGIVDLSTQSKLFLENVGVNDQKVSDLNMQLAVLDQVEQYVSSKSKNDGIVPATLGLNDDVLTKLLQRLYEAESSYNRLKETTAENSPTLMALANEIEKTRPEILENVRNQRKNLQASLKNSYGNYWCLYCHARNYSAEGTGITGNQPATIYKKQRICVPAPKKGGNGFIFFLLCCIRQSPDRCR